MQVNFNLHGLDHSTFAMPPPGMLFSATVSLTNLVKIVKFMILGAKKKRKTIKS